MSTELTRILDNAYEHIQHEDYNDALSSVLEAKELLNTRTSLKEELIEKINKKKRGRRLSLVDLGLDEAIEIIKNHE